MKETNANGLRAAASRANGAKSRGPVTPSGKARSAQNATRHGLYSQTLLLPGENPAELESLREYYYRRFLPADQPEVDLVETMIASMWRLRRIARIEAGLLVYEFESAGKAVSHFDALAPEQQESLAALRHLNLNAAAISALDRQEARLYRHFSRAMNDLIKLRKNFPPPPQEDPETPECENSRNEPSARPRRKPSNVIPFPEPRPARRPAARFDFPSSRTLP